MNPDETTQLRIKYGADGLIAAIAQDAASGEVLMLAWMNGEALHKTLETGEAHYWSRSRGGLWHKGATSGSIQRVHAVYIDCDQDCILLQIDQANGACHTGRRSCFYRKITGTGAGLSLTPATPGAFGEKPACSP